VFGRGWFEDGDGWMVGGWMDGGTDMHAVHEQNKAERTNNSSFFVFKPRYSTQNEQDVRTNGWMYGTVRNNRRCTILLFLFHYYPRYFKGSGNENWVVSKAWVALWNDRYIKLVAEMKGSGGWVEVVK